MITSLTLVQLPHSSSLSPLAKQAEYLLINQNRTGRTLTIQIHPFNLSTFTPYHSSFPPLHPTIMSSSNTLPSINRYITTHSASGEAVLDTTIPSTAIWRHIPGASFFLGYVTRTFPIDLKDDIDLNAYTDAFASPPKVTVPGGTVLRVMDLAPGTSSPMHRTVSLDYSVVLEGEVELQLDSGETKVMRRGDMCVQRATNHAWRNTNQTEWARMLYVYIDSTKPMVGGRKLGESIGVVNEDSSD